MPKAQKFTCTNQINKILKISNKNDLQNFPSKGKADRTKTQITMMTTTKY